MMRCLVDMRLVVTVCDDGAMVPGVLGHGIGADVGRFACARIAA